MTMCPLHPRIRLLKLALLYLIVSFSYAFPAEIIDRKPVPHALRLVGRHHPA